MIKLPIKLLTPPVRPDRIPGVRKTRPQTPGTPAAPQKPGNGGGGSHGGSSAPDIPSFESLFRKMLERYVPETVEFEPVSEEVLRDTIGNWLRPAYEQAIQNRRERTERINAELDADAWSRGMGESTYLTDVKERQREGEARDVDTIESNYAATLAGELYNAIRSQQEQKIAVDRFNAEQINAARRRAAEAAETLYRTYLSAASKSGRSGGSGGTGGAEENADDPFDTFDVGAFAEGNIGKPDYRTIVNLLSRMSSAERSQLYDRGNASFAKIRAEILHSIGMNKFRELMTQFPA
jgi:hypothetical protein